MIINDGNFKNQLYELIENSKERHKIDVTKPAQFYLVQTLNKFMGSDLLFDVNTINEGKEKRELESISIKYLKLKDEREIKKLGDQCLFLYGYFYESLLKRGKADIHESIGSAAYGMCSGEPFQEIAYKFSDMGLLVNDIRLETGGIQEISDLIGWYNKTGDKRFKSLLSGRGYFVDQVKELV